MDTVLASVVAVAGTLIGSLSTYLFQQRTAERTSALAREERLRQERLTAYSGYAGAVTELKRGVITLWFVRRRSQRDGTYDGYRDAQVESDRLGAAAETAAFRLHLVADDPALRQLMDTVSSKIGKLDKAETRDELVAIEAEFEQAVRAFLDAAAQRVR